MNDFEKKSLNKHLKHKGKVGISSKFGKIRTKADLAIAYTPGVAAVSSYIKYNPSRAAKYSIKGNTVAVISDGSAVLGLGNIGPLGALPVMEGKAILFKEFANIDAYPIVLETQEPEEIINTITAISPTFGGINLEDIAAPKCFEIENILKEKLDIPVMHDDQHGTAIVILAALTNAIRVARKDKKVKILICGAGAAGIATVRLLYKAGYKNIVVTDSQGVLSKKRKNINSEKKKLLSFTNNSDISGDLNIAIEGVDVFIGVSAPHVLTADMVKKMALKPIVFAMANPVPEIDPKIAIDSGAFIVGTGRSDYPNQINNVLAFPGIFRGALDNRVRIITDDIKLKASLSVANHIKDKELTPDRIIPSPLDKTVAKSVANSFK